tara:strand:+ start:176 stop:1348 length:1173 start_codon:yes stop_codon:yes gene_type:complete
MKLFFKYLKHILFIGTIGYFVIYPILHTLEEINPLKKELSDFRFTDIYFGHFKDKKIDNDIILVDIGFKNSEKTRIEITDFLNLVNENFKPKVIALDVDFKYDTTVSNEVNNNLILALKDDNISMYYDLIKINNQWLKDKSEINIDYSGISEGYTNCLVEKDAFGVLRFFQPYLINQKDTLKHLSLVIAESFGSTINTDLMVNKKTMINFGYSFNNIRDITDTTKLEIFKDKIVIVGLFTKNNLDQPLYNDDVHYTSSNKNYLGKSFPNMYGGEVLATIVANIKDNSFIKYYHNLSFILNIILSFIIYFLLLYFKTFFHELYGTIEILIKFIFVIFFILISIYFIGKSNIYIDLTMVGIISFFAVEFVGPIDHLIDRFESWITKFKTNRK